MTPSCAEWAQAEEVDTQEVGGGQEMHWIGLQDEKSTLMLSWWCPVLASGLEVLLGALTVPTEPWHYGRW